MMGAMPTADDLVAQLFRALNPKPAATPAAPDEVRAIVRDLAAVPPKDLFGALAKVEGEHIDKVMEGNLLQRLAAAVAEHGDAAGRLAVAKVLALLGAPKPSGADKPGAGAAAAKVLTADPATIASLKVEKGQFPQILVDGIYWNGVFTSRGKYNDPPPTHDHGPSLAWSAAVAKAGSGQLKAACIRAGLAALERFPPVGRKAPEKNAPDDPFGLKAAGAEKERTRAARRAPAEALLTILAGDTDGGAIDDLRAGGGSNAGLAKLFQVALELDDAVALELLGRVVAAVCPNGAGATPEAAARMAFVAAALDRAFDEWKADMKKKASVYARVALASLGKKSGASSFALATKKEGETVDPVAAALEQRYIEKHGEADPKKQKRWGLKGTKVAEEKAAIARKSGKMAAEPPPPDLVSQSAIADMFRPREPKGDGSYSALGDKTLGEAIGAGAAERFKAAFVRAFEAASAVAVVAET
jgi:hypothetical protein